MQQPDQDEDGEEDVHHKHARKRVRVEGGHRAEIEPEGQGLEDPEEEGDLGTEGVVDEACVGGWLVWWVWCFGWGCEGWWGGGFGGYVGAGVCEEEGDCGTPGVVDEACVGWWFFLGGGVVDWWVGLLGQGVVVCVGSCRFGGAGVYLGVERRKKKLSSLSLTHSLTAHDEEEEGGREHTHTCIHTYIFSLT
jgi:hypothetical protein